MIDTSPAANARYHELLRAMPPERRLEVAMSPDDGRRPVCYRPGMTAHALKATPATLEDLFAIPEEERKRFELVEGAIEDRGATSGAHGGTQFDLPMWLALSVDDPGPVAGGLVVRHGGGRVLRRAEHVQARRGRLAAGARTGAPARRPRHGSP